MNFLEVILGNLERTPEKVILSEVHESGLVSTSCRQLCEAIDAGPLSVAGSRAYSAVIVAHCWHPTAAGGSQWIWPSWPRAGLWCRFMRARRRLNWRR